MSLITTGDHDPFPLPRSTCPSGRRGAGGDPALGRMMLGAALGTPFCCPWLAAGVSASEKTASMVAVVRIEPAKRFLILKLPSRIAYTISPLMAWVIRRAERA